MLAYIGLLFRPNIGRSFPRPLSPHCFLLGLFFAFVSLMRLEEELEEVEVGEEEERGTLGGGGVGGRHDLSNRWLRPPRPPCYLGFQDEGRKKRVLFYAVYRREKLSSLDF